MNNYNFSELNQEEALHLIKFFIKSEKNVFLFGRRGTGKTEICLEAINKLKYKPVIINLSVIERVDLAGYPNLQTISEYIDYKLPNYLQFNEKSVILFDEVDKANNDLIAPLLEILQFKSINGKKLNIQNCILTSNLYEEKINNLEVNSALLDRGAKFILNFDFDKWVLWAQNNNINPLIISFLQINKDLCCGKLIDLPASPSPRSWALASDSIDKAHQNKILDIETVSNIVAGFVGYEAALKFKIWYKHYREFEPYANSILNGKNVIDYNKLAQTEKLILIVTLCAIAKNKVNIKNTINNLCKFIVLNKVDKELQVVGFFNSFDFDFIIKNKLNENKAFFDIFTELNKSLIKENKS